MYIRISFIFLGQIESTPSLSHIQHAVKTDQNVRMWIKGCDCILELDFLFFQFLRTLMKLLSLRSLFIHSNSSKRHGTGKPLSTVPDTQ